MIYTLNLLVPRTEYNALAVYTIKNTILTTLYFHKQADIHCHYTTIIIVLLTEPTPSFTIHGTILTPQHFQKTNNQIVTTHCHHNQNHHPGSHAVKHHFRTSFEITLLEANEQYTRL